MADEYIKKDTAINEAICAVYWALNQHGNVNGQVIIDRFNAIPSADVVKVVGCKDCKYWMRERISCEGLARCATGESGIRYRSENDFCSRGARMDGGT